MIKILVIFLTFLMTSAVSAAGNAGPLKNVPDNVKVPHVPKGLNIKTDVCDKTGQQWGHTVVVIDVTSPLDPLQKKFIKLGKT